MLGGVTILPTNTNPIKHQNEKEDKKIILLFGFVLEASSHLLIPHGHANILNSVAVRNQG